MANMGDGKAGRSDDGTATERVATPLVTALVTSEQGVFAVRRQARAVAAALGLGGQDQIRTATALSEVCRRMLDACGQVTVAIGLDPPDALGAVRTAGFAVGVGTACVGDVHGRRPVRRGRASDEGPHGSLGDRSNRRRDGGVDVACRSGGTGGAAIGRHRGDPSRRRSAPRRHADGGAGRTQSTAAGHPGRGAATTRRPVTAQHRARGDEPRCRRALHRAVRGTRSHQPRCRRALRRTRPTYDAGAGGERGQDPLPRQRQPRAAVAGHLDRRPDPAAARPVIRSAD